MRKNDYNQSQPPSGLLQSVLHGLSCPLYLLDMDAQSICFCNQALKKLFGWDDAVLGARLGDLSFPAFYSAIAAMAPAELWEECREGNGRFHAADSAAGKSYAVTVQAVAHADSGRFLLYLLQDGTDQPYIPTDADKRREMISDIARSLAAERESNVSINRALEQIGAYLGVDRAFVSRFDKKYAQMEFLYGWEALSEGVTSIFENPITQPGPYYIEKIRENWDSVYIVEDVREIVQRMGGLKAASDYAVKSLAAFPIILSGRLWGVLEFNSITQHRRWSQEDIMLGGYLCSVLTVFIGRQLAAPELDKSNKIIHTIMDNIPSAVFWKDLHSIYRGCNQYFAKFVGYAGNRIIGQAAVHLFPREFVEKNEEYDRYLLAGNTGHISYTMKLQEAGGAPVFIQVKKAVIFDDTTGDAVYIVGVYENIGESYVLESPQRDPADPHVLKFIDIIDNPVFYVDDRGNFDLKRSGKFAFAGYSQDDLYGLNLYDFLEPNDSATLKELIENMTARLDTVQGFVGRVTAKDGRQLDYAFELRPIFSRSSYLRGVQITYSDQTEQKKSRRRQERMSKIVDRSPLVTIAYNTKRQSLYCNPAVEAVSGYSPAEAAKLGLPALYGAQTADYIRHTVIPEVLTNGTATFTAAINRRDGQVRPLLHTCFFIDAEGVELGIIAVDAPQTQHRQLPEAPAAGKPQPELGALYPREFHLETTLRNICRTAAPAIEKKSLSFLAHPDPELPAHIICDEQCLIAAVTGLLQDSAQMASPGGSVRLCVTAESRQGQELLRFEMCSHGFAPEAAARLWNTDFASAASMQAAERLGGSTRAELQGVDSINLSFTAPFRRGKEAPPPRLHADIDPARLRMLVVDSCAHTRDHLADMITGLSIDCDTAVDADAARKMFAHALYAKPYDMLFADRRIAGIGGPGLLSHIRQLSRDCAFILLSPAAEYVETGESLSGTGVSAVLEKPVFPSSLIAAVNSCAGPEKTAADAAAPRHSRQAILLAEDVLINREIVKAYLEDTGLDIDCAENGLEALQLFMRNPNRYSLILMDIHMPDMDGYEATRRIRALPFDSARSVPIIALTANVFQQDVLKCLDAGMNDHIGKPIDVEEFFTKVGSYCTLKGDL